MIKFFSAPWIILLLGISVERLFAEEFPNRQKIGMNLAGIIDFQSQIPFANVFKTARPWMKDEAELRAIPLTTNGYPLLKSGQSLDYFMLTIEGGHYPAGVYTATYKGKGRVEMRRFSVDQVITETSGRIEARVKPGPSLLLTILQTDPADPIRDIVVSLPGLEHSKSPFNPAFIERLKPFGTIRFMDFQRMNDSPVKTWAERAQLSDARWSGDAGAPIEIMVELANRLKANPWFCMPHLADDHFVRQFATLVKSQLDPNLIIYIEHSNEVWNMQFGQARYAAQKGKEMNLSSNAYQAQLFYHSRRSLEIFRLWSEVFGPDARKRLVRVMASHAANPWASEQVLTYQDAFKECDALAIAPYFGHSHGEPKHLQQTLALSAEQLAAELLAEVNGRNKAEIEKQAAVARKYQVKLLAYEGGQHLVGIQGAENNEALTRLFTAVNRHPHMKRIYQQHLEHWYAAGGDLFVAFSNVAQPSKWGCWGALEYQEQPLAEAPKYRALLDYSQRKQSR
ncbi:MAG: hypothetical protein SFY81_06155 [Verrucomicrobiota bacterium]|nr:hypothetical protein [Verrucomicrobiota bacterium]